MDIRELRIGNLINCDGQIITISSPSVCAKEPLRE